MLPAYDLGYTGHQELTDTDRRLKAFVAAHQHIRLTTTGVIVLEVQKQLGQSRPVGPGQFGRNPEISPIDSIWLVLGFALRTMEVTGPDG